MDEARVKMKVSRAVRWLLSERVWVARIVPLSLEAVRRASRDWLRERSVSLTIHWDLGRKRDRIGGMEIGGRSQSQTLCGRRTEMGAKGGKEEEVGRGGAGVREYREGETKRDPRLRKVVVKKQKGDLGRKSSIQIPKAQSFSKP